MPGPHGDRNGTLIAIFSGAYHGILDEVIVRGTRKLRSYPVAAEYRRRQPSTTCVWIRAANPGRTAGEQADELAAIMVEPLRESQPWPATGNLHGLAVSQQRHGAALHFR